MMSFYCQIISFGLEMKSFVAQRKYNYNNKIIYRATQKLLMHRRTLSVSLQIQSFNS